MAIAHVYDRSRVASLHITAFLFTLENNSLHQKMTTGTSLPCSWLPPSCQAVTYSEIAGIEFTTAKLKRKEANQMIALTLVPPKNEIRPHQMKQTFS